VTTFEETSSPISVLNHTCTIPVPTALTIVQAVNFKQEFQQLCLNNPHLACVVFDFSQTQFMDSSGIGALVNCWKLAQKQNVRLILQDVSQQILSILVLADLDRLFEFNHSATPPQQQTSQLVEMPPPVADSTLGEAAYVTHPSVHSRAKRLIDIAGALVGLTITGLLFIPIAVAIKLDSPGPLLFGQTRCSWMGRRFKMWKFRSMVSNAEKLKHMVKNEASGAIFKNANDPRITRVGKFLRRSSLDELPQFWNVLKGEMSLVGTRPPTPDEVEKYEIPQWQRLDIKPGMTGEWQVNGRSSIQNFEDIVQLDLKYQENWSLWYDLQLILKTIQIIFKKNSGAA